jgi:uncharacterized protein (TIGR03435 family)
MIDRQVPGRIMRSIAAGFAVAAVLGVLDAPSSGWAQSQAAAAASAAQAAAPKSFEVASIKPVAAENNGMVRIAMGIQPGGRYVASGVTASILIQQAYDIKDYQISGGPSWITTDRFDIVAKAETPNLDRETLRQCLQSLLAERFNLKIHRESKDLPIYNLLVGKTGHKLKLSETQPAPPSESQPPDPSKDAKMGVGGGGVAAGGGAAGGVAAGGAPAQKGSQMRMGRGQVSAQMVPVSGIAALLAQQLSRPVIDKTDIKGSYDFNLQWTPDETQRGMGFGGVERPVSDAPLPSDPTGPSLFTAIQDQLGLRLEASKGPVEILVIDRIEKPSGD